MIQAGKLRHRVVIQKQAESQNQSDGSIIVEWVDVAKVWCAIEPLSAREFVSAQAEASKITTRITVRYRSDITAKMRLYHAAKDMYYNIEGVLADKDSGIEYLTLPCSEGVRYQDGEPDAVLPVILEYPEIDGSPVIGGVLTASDGLWANEPNSYEYQWYLNDVSVVGAIGKTWIVAGDVDDLVTVGVKAVNSSGVTNEEFSDGVIVTA